MPTLFPANHWLFQMANCCLAISYVVGDILILRSLLAVAALCFALWGGLVLNVALDTVLWNSVFVVLNCLQAAKIIYMRRPIKFEHPMHDEIYEVR